VDAQKSFLLHTHTVNDLYNQIQKEIDNCYSLKQTLQPIVCIVGTEYISIKEFYVYYFNTYYKFTNIVKAIDTCFKIIYVFNLKYPLKCGLVWTFIQKYIYKIDLNTDIKNASLTSLISDMRD
jgi:hypothetical protein